MIETSPTEEQLHGSHFNGIYVETAIPSPSNRRTHPVIFIHGGLHGSWCFKYLLEFFAERGWEGHALNFLNRSHSASLPRERFIQRSSADCAQDVVAVASKLDSPPIVVAHGLGGLVAQKFAEENPVHALVLLAPVVSAEAGVAPLNIPCDLNEPFPVPSFEQARGMFLGGLDDEQAHQFYSLLCPESPKLVSEALNFSVSVDYKKIKCPILAFGAENDVLVPADYVRVLANLSGAKFHFLKGRGHNILLEPNWRETATVIGDWLASL